MANDPSFGAVVENWAPPPAPDFDRIQGRFARLERIDPDRHSAQLFQSYQGHDNVWDYLPYGPFHSNASYYKFVDDIAQQSDPRMYAICDVKTGHALGVASYLRINPDAGSIEVGHINYSPAMQQTPLATEAMFLMMRWAFDAGYRRYEWKCNAQNMASRRAAQRLGFSFEGIFRQAAVIKGRNRDTAWFAAIDTEWPALKEAFQLWLSPENFDDAGRQRDRLGNLTRLILAQRDPILER